MISRMIKACVLTIVIAGLLNTSRAVPPQANPPARGGTAGPTQPTKPGGDEDLATITQSRSTNTPAYKVVIHNDGSATEEIGPRTHGLRPGPAQSQQFPPGTIDTKTLRRLLTAISDVSRIPVGICAKSVSFGTRTLITYAGRTSGDLQCVRREASGDDVALLQESADLARFVQTTLDQLRPKSMLARPKPTGSD